jgi:hypothetical protein
MHQRCRPCNRYLSNIRDNVITTGSITAAVAVASSNAGDDLSSNLVNFGRKRPIDAKRTGRKGHKAIGAVNPATSPWIAHTHLPTKRPTRGKPQQVKTRR